MLRRSLRSARSLRSLVAPTTLATLALAAACSTGCSSSSATDADNDGTGADTTTLARPPQYVLMAFDGSLGLTSWENTRALGKAANAKFTYFMSGPYFLPNAKKAMYHGPHHNVGASDIGFGGPATDIPKRLQEVIDARAEGHEMGSHANGHFDGTAWSKADWDNEFNQWGPLIFDAGKNSGLESPDLGFTLADVKGFRAPLLAQNASLYTTLAEQHFVYDTSKTAPTNYWPEKLGGIWNFPLAQVRIASGAHQGIRTLSMDYNFYYAQSKGLPQPANSAAYEKEMIDTYMAYFQGNYFGNRAPVSIGHHFESWNGGAYWTAMQAFANKVCNLPEVKCVTYSELVTFMEANVKNRAALQAGKFTQMARPPGVDAPAPVEDAVADEDLESAGLVSDQADAEEDEYPDTQ